MLELNVLFSNASVYFIMKKRAVFFRPLRTSRADVSRLRSIGQAKSRGIRAKRFYRAACPMRSKAR